MEYFDENTEVEVVDTIAPEEPFSGEIEEDQVVFQQEVYEAPEEPVTSNYVTPDTFSTSGAAAVTSESSALAEFNAQFRALAEKKDDAERQAKAARKAAGKQALAAMLAEHKSNVASRKERNRKDEKANEQRLLDSIDGDTWNRVVTLTDLHAAPVVPVADGEKKSKEDAPKDISRMKEVINTLVFTAPATKAK